MQHRTAAFIHSKDIEQYHYPEDCPFRTERAEMTKSMLESMGLYTGNVRRQVSPIPATLDEALWFHAPEYLETLKNISQGTFDPSVLEMGIGQPETPIFKGVYDYSLLAAGGTLTGARLLLDNSVEIAFNPSGGFHHALSSEAGGFCYINDIVLACHALKKAGKRVFCLDLDAHHGNGTQAAFYNDPDVFTVSFHETGTTLYPWGGFEPEIGQDAGKGFNVNVSLPPQTDDRAFGAAFEQIVPPLLRAYNPDIIVLEIGMDVLSGDPLTHLDLTNNGIADVLPALLDSPKPMLVTGGGGYHPKNTARGWALVWTVLCGLEETNDEWVGMGGVFLGSTEWAGGLRDMKSFAGGEEKKMVITELEKSVTYIKDHVFPLHGIE